MSFDLLTTVETGGCSAKIPPRQLEELLKDFPLPADPRILVDISTHDDAGVYKINDETALVITTDFFPPMVSDGYEFGLIAATNSISDIYAMGGTPLVALNIMMFPSSRIPMEVYRDILRGGNDKACEAGVSIIGGHTIDDFPPKYGLAVIGTPVGRQIGAFRCERYSIRLVAAQAAHADLPRTFRGRGAAEDQHRAVRRVARLVLQVGAMTGVIPHFVREYYPEACAGTRLEGSEIRVEEEPALVFCRECGEKRGCKQK